jgi:hypothetical protein
MEGLLLTIAPPRATFAGFGGTAFAGSQPPLQIMDLSGALKRKYV